MSVEEEICGVDLCVLRLSQIRITFKNQELLKGVSWEVKKGERVGLVGESSIFIKTVIYAWTPNALETQALRLGGDSLHRQ